MNMCHCTMENPYYNSCARNKWANLTFILRQTACVNLLPASCTFYWKNHFGFIIMAVRGASRVIYTFHIYEKKSAPYCAPLRKSLSNFHLNPAHVRGWLNIQNVDPSSEHPRGPSLINGISGYLAGIVTWQWGFFPPPPPPTAPSALSIRCIWGLIFKIFHLWTFLEQTLAVMPEWMVFNHV